MKIFRTISEIKSYLRPLKYSGKSIGFVPTMGYLHKGHLSLIRNSVNGNDITILSIFVNPTQFGPNEDFEKYPRNEKLDLELAQNAGAKVAFIPTVDEMYQNRLTTVNVAELTENLCGTSRPTHFSGVTTVVTKLFNIIAPTYAYFGQKDAQQAIVLTKMAQDLNMDVEIKICPIVREPDGLAMSSRNVYLSEKERKEATILQESLKEAKKQIGKGEKNTETLKKLIGNRIQTTSGEIDYIEIVDFETLKSTNMIKGKTLIALAVKFSKCRLIDNIIID